MHVFGLFHVWLALSTVLMTEGLSLSIWVPLIVCLDMSMVLIERVIQVTVDPGKLWDMAEEEWHLLVLTDGHSILLSKRIEFLVHVGVHDLVSKIVVRFTRMVVIFRVG